ncbi:iron chelate uptake ABC transporter family permease subunit, partial [Paracoccus sp. APAP_BH8]
MIAAVAALPLAEWPALPWRIDEMSVGQILLAYGLMLRGILALLAGAALGLAGALMQAVLRNPLADPTTPGTASGAQLAIVAATIHAPGWLAGGNLPVVLTPAGAATFLIMALGARRGFAPVTVTFAGMLVGLMASALATAMTRTQGHYLLSRVMWNGGVLAQVDRSGSRNMALALLPALASAAALARPLMVMSLGPEGAWAGPAVGAAAPCHAAAGGGAVGHGLAEIGLVGFVGLGRGAAGRGGGDPAAADREPDDRARAKPLRDHWAGSGVIEAALWLCRSVSLWLTQTAAGGCPPWAARGRSGGCRRRSICRRRPWPARR